MSKPVNTEAFWKSRLDQAEQITDSVYLTVDSDWSYIDKSHEEILEPYKDKKVLDAGCGYGRWSHFFSNYTGVDFSPDFIDKAKELFPDKYFEQQDLKKLPYKDNEFDMAFCVSVKNMIIGNLGKSEWDLMEKELKRVSKEVLFLEYTNPNEFDIIMGYGDKTERKKL